MAKPSVLFINRVYPPVKGATGRVLRDLAHGFARDGWDVTVLSTGSKTGEAKDGPIKLKLLKTIPHQTAFAYFVLWLRFLMAALFMKRFDMVVTLTDPPLLVAAGRIIARFKKSTHIHWCHDLYPDILPVLGLKLPLPIMNFLKRSSRRAMKSCNRVVVIGRCMAKHLSFSGLDMTKVTIIPNWPDFELSGKSAADVALGAERTTEGTTANAKSPQSSPSQPKITVATPIKVQSPANANASLSTPSAHNSTSSTSLSDAAQSHTASHIASSAAPNAARPFFVDDSPKFRVLYSGNLGRAHPISTIIEAASLLLPHHPEIEFVFVGDGLGFDRIAHERARRGLDNIRLLPAQPLSRLKDLMESGDVHLISMSHEAAGMLVPSKLYAALAAGRPCILIGPEQTETARVIRDYGAGAIVEQGNPRKLAEEILALRMNGDNWFAAMSGAKRAGQDYAPTRAISSWLKNARETIRHKNAA